VLNQDVLWIFIHQITGGSMCNRLIAVAVTVDGAVSPHAGRAMVWQVFVLASNPLPQLVWTVCLTDAGSLHEWHVREDNTRHPLHAVDVAIVGSAGEGVTRRLQEKGIELVTTTESDPLKAVLGYLQGVLPDGLPHDEAACLDPAHRQERALENN
jgi:hypothetical protein